MTTLCFTIGLLIVEFSIALRFLIILLFTARRYHLLLVLCAAESMGAFWWVSMRALSLILAGASGITI